MNQETNVLLIKVDTKRPSRFGYFEVTTNLNGKDITKRVDNTFEREIPYEEQLALGCKPFHVYLLSNVMPFKPVPGDLFIFWDKEHLNEVYMFKNDRGFGISARNQYDSISCVLAASLCSNKILASTDGDIETTRIQFQAIREFLNLELDDCGVTMYSMENDEINNFTFETQTINN